MTLSHVDQESDEEGILLPHSSPSRLGTQGHLVLLLNWYPHFLDQSYTLCNSDDSIAIQASQCTARRQETTEQHMEKRSGKQMWTAGERWMDAAAQDMQLGRDEDKWSVVCASLAATTRTACHIYINFMSHRNLSESANLR